MELSYDNKFIVIILGLRVVFIMLGNISPPLLKVSRIYFMYSKIHDFSFVYLFFFYQEV